MSFNFTTPGFYLLLFVTSLLVLFALRDRRKWQLLVLLGASYLFFFLASGFYLLLLVASTLVDYFVGRELVKRSGKWSRRLLLITSIILNLGILGVFKYTDFFIGSANNLGVMLGRPLDLPLMGLLLPVGISFYTFQSMSYSIDMFRRHGEVINDPLDFALYVSFFPQLVAGPIVRNNEFISQIQEPLGFSTANLRIGVTWIIYGLAKKLVIADNLGNQVAIVFDDGLAFNHPILVFWGALAFGLQIYCDFSAYTDIALGAGRIFGIKLPENFDWPYLARNPREFWSRWHQSLSRWLKDYLYFPLGGNRKGRVRSYGNLMITMLLGGLWHGAAWNFVLWGGMHGAFLVVHKMVADSRPLRWLRERGGWVYGLIALGLTQYLVFYTWLLFRIGDLGNLGRATLAYFFLDPAIFSVPFITPGAFLAFLLAVGFMIMHPLSHHFGGFRNRLARAPTWIWAMGLSGLLMTIWWLTPSDRPAFIYFRF